MSDSKHTIYGSLTALDREDVTRVLWTRTGEWTQASEVEREIEHLRQQRDELLQAAKAALHYMRLHKYADQAWADDLERAIAKSEGRSDE